MVIKLEKNILMKYCIVILFIVGLVVSGCSSSKKLPLIDPEDIFKEGVRLFNDGDYLEAQKMFDVIKLQYPTSQLSDDAQYYLAEVYYKQKQFILAAFNYNYLRQHFTQSEYVKISFYKAGESYYQLSPTYERDQEYTLKAIQTFQEFQYAYPTDSLAIKAGKLIDELRNKLGYREFSTAILYERLQQSKSALVYYNVVIDDYPDTKYFEPALLGKIQILYKIKNYDDAQSMIDVYKRKFPISENIGIVNDVEKKIKNR